MRVVIQDHLLPQKLIQIDNDQVRITDKGRHRCNQFRHMDELEWNETMKRLGELSSTTWRVNRVGEALNTQHKRAQNMKEINFVSSTIFLTLQ
jgi:hypothetical protein